MVLVAAMSVIIDKDKKLGLSYDGISYFVILQIVWAAIYLWGAGNAFWDSDFHYRNELSIIYLSGLCLFLSVWFLVVSIGAADNARLKVIIIVLAQLGLVMSAGYEDGKKIFTGSLDVGFLEQKELCGLIGGNNWVYIEKYGGVAFFMDSNSKKICILDELNFTVIPRPYLEFSKKVDAVSDKN